MAKAQGIIGNFKGKVGNMVGYQLTDSNNKQTQGIRIYQPNVKNPKTSAQAEQRAKLAPINATYRALKMIIDRGNEGLPYGNKSRLAWLKQAFKAEKMPWFIKGTVINSPVLCQLTKGSLPGLDYEPNADGILISCDGVDTSSAVGTIGAVSTLLKAAYPSLKDGDQITFVTTSIASGILYASMSSFILNPSSTDVTVDFIASEGQLMYTGGIGDAACAVIVSREGDNGEHLRSSEMLRASNDATAAAPYDATSKTAAIESYMASGAANTDWAEESID